ncbi:hypothetical protein [Nannocystis punicea]|uniref:Uncharacterized protein n=1 Tax=Nannocystis punicea TaxID=2995304 RepID=A0ABY7H664_9BACT|nr:hypothetical protein [Nannocystis poenicansa]WAS94565.1 hypothetical protein O0S08_00260 [Nannocystis poenicansa]
MRHRVHRAYAGETKSPVLVRDADERLPYYEGDEPPTAPAGAVIETRTQANWDGGPPLVERVAIVEEELSLPAERRAAVEAALAAVVPVMAAWGVGPLATCTWVVGEPRALSLAAQRRGDCLRALHEVVWEVASDHGLNLGNEYGSAARAQEWERMAHADVVFPEELEDPYYAYGPSGPPVVPKGWRRRPVRELEDPFAPLLALASAGFQLLKLAGDEAVLCLPAADS